MKKWALFFLILIQCIAFEATAKPVVCIHGFMTTCRSMLPITLSLRSAGFQAFSWDHPSRSRTIEENACYLVSYLQEIACCCPGEPIDFVSHSTGALILRAALNIPGCPEEAKRGRVVLLVPPNQGSSLARRFSNFPPAQLFMGSKGGWELMNYDGCDIKRCFGSFPSSVEVLVIAGTKGNRAWFCEPNDNFVAVAETALDTPYYFESFPVDHSKILTCPGVLCKIRQFLCCGCEVPEPTCVELGNK